jgi:hypothetical protein
MTPKEKAFDLIRLYRNIEFDNGENCYLMISIKNAKQCALIVVEQILKLENQNSYNYLTENKEQFIIQLADSYWLEVKKEIENL